MKIKILSVEDDATIRALIEESLRGHLVTFASNLKEAASALKEAVFDVVLIDIELPDGDGLKFFAKQTKENTSSQASFLFITGQTDISNKIMAFSLGADDFIPKPFDPLELKARVESKYVKTLGKLQENRQKNFGNVLVDFDRQKAFILKNGQELDAQLTTLEFKILGLLTKRMEMVYSREQILDQVWGNAHITDRTVDSHIAHLRSKIENSDIILETVKGAGYRAVLKK